MTCKQTVEGEISQGPDLNRRGFRSAGGCVGPDSATLAHFDDCARRAKPLRKLETNFGNI